MNYDIEKLNEFFAEHPDDISIADIDMARIPRHISCIMDGNGRWATSVGLGRGEGHKAGIVALQDVITACVRMGVDVLSAYAFSTENWNRPQAEVDLLMYLFAKTFVDELPLLKRENVRVEFLGDIFRAPKKTRDVFERGLAETRDHTGMTLALAVNYGGRAEITRAVRHIAEAVSTGDIAVEQIDDALVADHLYTAGLPDPGSSSARRVSCVSRTTCCGRSPIASFISPIRIGPISIDGGLSAPLPRSRAVTADSAVFPGLKAGGVSRSSSWILRKLPLKLRRP